MMDEQLERACVACDSIYRGGLACPACGEPGEPLEDAGCESCGSWELLCAIATTDSLACASCGESHTVH